MSSHRRFRWLLPLLAFGITFVALAVPASILYQRLRLSPQGAANAVHFYMPERSVASFVLLSVTNLEEKAITALHVPGMFGEVLVSLPTTWPDSWHPAFIPLLDWRSISLPVFCLPFWWFVGLGIDRLSSCQRTHWTILALGTLLSVGMLILGVGLTVVSYTEHESSIVISVAGFYLWTVLFAVFPYLWFAQRRWQ